MVHNAEFQRQPHPIDSPSFNFYLEGDPWAGNRTRFGWPLKLFKLVRPIAVSPLTEAEFDEIRRMGGL